MLPSSACNVLHNWIRCLNEGRLDDVLELYAPDATLLPTFAPEFIRAAARRRAYFEELAAHPNLRVQLNAATLTEQPLPGSLAILSGAYTFSFDHQGRTHRTEARFTFVLDPSQPAPILHHHSSLLPKP